MKDVQQTWNEQKNEDSEEEMLINNENNSENLTIKKPTEMDDEEEIITALASCNSLIAQIPLCIFYNLQDKFPRSITRLTRSIISKLQRVTLLTMNKYFGLTNQLVNDEIKTVSPKRRKFGPRDDLMSKENQLRRDFEIGLRGFKKLLDLDEGGCELLRQNLLIEQHIPGSIIMAPKDPYGSLNQDFTNSNQDNQNDATEPCLYFIIRGCVDVYLHDDAHITQHEDDEEVSLINNEDSLLYSAHSGDLIGQLAVVTGDFYYRVVASSSLISTRKSMNNYRNVVPRRSNSRGAQDQTIILGKLKKTAFDQIVMYSPLVMNRIVYMIFLQLAPVVKLIDYAVDWEQRHAGEIVIKQGEITEGMHIVLSGRLRAIRSKNEFEEKHRADRERENDLFAIGDDSLHGNLIAEYGRGDSFGALEVLTDTPFSLNIIAVRDTELAIISSRLFKIFMRKFPEVVVRMSQIIGDSWRKQVESLDQSAEDHSNLSTIAVLGINPNTPTSLFCSKLARELQELNPTAHLDKNYALQSVGKNIFTDEKETHLIRWLGEMEEIYKFVVYECDNTLSPWTQRCLRQADCILLVSYSDDNYEISVVEQYLLQNSNIAARKELVLLHKDSFYPKNTIDWLNLRRGWCRACHHVMDFKINGNDFYSNDSENVKFHASSSNSRSKSSRPSLHHTGSLNILRPIPGLIKRGAGSIWKRIKSSHNNSLYGKQAPTLFGLANPRDDIARLSRLLTGTAIGLVLGGGGARGCSHVGVIQALEENGIPIDMVGGTSIGSMIGALYARDPDYIHVLTKSRSLAKRLSNKWNQILDLTYPRVSFFTGSALNDVLRIELKNTQVEDLRLNYFAISTNITHSKMMVHREGQLWRYVRASMSLVGFVPPICNHDGSLLVDGGYTNNIPADVMRSMGINTIIAVDVGGEVDTNYANYGDSLSGWWLLWNKWNPFVTRERIPNLSDIQAQLAYVSSEVVLEKVKKMKRCLYLRPPITQYGTLDFAKFDEIKEVGYTYAQEKISEWKKQRTHYSKPPESEPKVSVLRRRSSAGAQLQKFTQ